MPELKNHISPEHADLLRVVGRWDDNADTDWYMEALAVLPIQFFRPHDGSPISRVIRRDNRATCRECGEIIAAGQEGILFGYQAIPIGRVSNAYIHSHAAECVRRIE